MTGEVAAALAPHGLTLAGAFHPRAGDGAPAGVGTLALVAPGQGFWPVFRASQELADGAPDPMDRWSRRVIGAVAERLDARPLFPFGGPPWLPFQRWAERAEGARPSPVGMLVSPQRGLWLSYRGALSFGARLPLSPATGADPCVGCPAPCLSACPAGAFAGGRYDVAACVAHVAGAEGRVCREGGCLVRHACPAGRAATPPPAQCAFHMAAFLSARLDLGAGAPQAKDP